MKTVVLNIDDLKEIPELKNFYVSQSIDDLVQSLVLHGQKTPIHVNCDYEIINGYRMVSALKKMGSTTVFAIIMDGNPDIYDRIILNQTRVKTTIDLLSETREVFKHFPKSQGKKLANGQKYLRSEIISSSLNNRWKGDNIIRKLEYILNNDLESDVLSKGIIEKNWKVDTCFDFLTNKKKIDSEKSYGFTEKLIDGTFSISEVNKFIDQRLALDTKFDYSFVIPEKANFYNMDCVLLSELVEIQKTVDLIFTSIPYWGLKNYVVGEEEQLGHESTKEKFAMNIANIFCKLTNTLKPSSNVVINIGETYIDGVAQGIPFLVREYIEKYTSLVFKETILWNKKNPHPQSENVKRPINSIEYLWWFVVDPTQSKYNMLTFPVEGKKSQVTYGSKDVSKSGKQSKKSKSISKHYGKITNHLKEQDVENIITTSIGKDHELYNISSAGHPAPMSPMLPVTIALMLSDEGDLICDPFGGSNVVGKISLLLNRRYVGSELSKEYYDLGCQRLLNADNDFNRQELNQVNHMIYQNDNSSQYQLPIAA